MRWLTAGAMASVLVLGACGDDDDADPVDPEATATETGNDPDETEELDPAEALAQIAGQERGPVQVSYDITGADGDGRFTVAEDPPHRAIMMDSDEGQVLLIDADESAFCFDEGGQWECLAGGGGPSDESAFPITYESEDFDESDLDPDTRAVRETIAGRSAICLTVPEKEGATDVLVCFDEETGVMLRATGTYVDGGDFSIEAVEFGDPDPAMFVPPAEPTEFGS